MADLRNRFGELLAAHCRRQGLTQEGLATGLDNNRRCIATEGERGPVTAIPSNSDVPFEAD
jgi:hypothetical protein